MQKTKKVTAVLHHTAKYLVIKAAAEISIRSDLSSTQLPHEQRSNQAD